MSPPQCLERYHLEENEVHYHSGIDGSIFITDDNVFYTNEQYCVDFLYFTDSEDPDFDLKVKNITQLNFNTI